VRTAAFIAVGLTCGALLAACSRQPRDLTLAGATMGTTYHVTVVGPRVERRRDEVQALIDGSLLDSNRTFSTYDPQSEISAFNRNASRDWIPLSPALHELLATAQGVSVRSDGAFDVTVAPLVRLWGFGPDTTGGVAALAPLAPPGPEFLHDAMAAVGYRWLELRAAPPAARKQRVPLELDVNGIAPGYAVDRIAAALTAAGLPDHLVEIGGEVMAGGHRADGSPWRVAVEMPIAGDRRPYTGLALSNLAVSTSGDYRERRTLTDGRVAGHTLDPRTGEPVMHNLASVTVVHASAAQADAYATALLVLGPEQGAALAERLGLAALLLERTARPTVWLERATPQFQQLRRPVQ
jgi:thiamine biosynthesis lipoprotein